MLNLQPRYRKVLNLVIVFLIISIIMSWTTNDREKVSFLENAIHQLVLPFQKAFTVSTTFLRDGYLSIKDVRNVYVENKALKEQLEYYVGIEHQLNEARLTNRRLTRLLDFTETIEYDLEPAMVIGRSPDTWYSTLTISKGDKNGFEVGMPVVTNAGLVGRIIEVGPNNSKVQLVISPDSAVTSFVQRSRDIGLVRISSENPGFLELIRLSHSAEVRIGDTVMSSDLTENFPKGLVLGEVVKVTESNQQLTAIIKPSVDFDRLEEVLVIRETKFISNDDDYDDDDELEEEGEE